MKYTSQQPQLFMLHFAGGNNYSYNFLKPYLSPHFEVVTIELPGRGKRMNEKIIIDREEAIEDQLNEVVKRRKNDTEFVIYGHSMGAMLGFELVSKLEFQNDPPVNLVVSGNPGPGISREVVRSNLNKENFIIALRELGGIPEAVYENIELFDFFEPILRADFKIVEQGEGTTSKVINTPIYSIMGQDEKFIEEISNWQNFTSNKFKFDIFSGNHFFINSNPEALAIFITNAYNDTLVL